MLAAASLTSSAAVAYNTIYTGAAVERAALSPSVSTARSDGDRLEGVHASAADALTQRVLAAVPELASWEEWYAHPRFLANGHVHTIAAAKLRRTRAVRYYRDLVPTPDGGTLAIDLLAGVRRAAHANARSASSSLFTGGALPGAAEGAGGEAPPRATDGDLRAEREERQRAIEARLAPRLSGAALVCTY